MKFKEFLKTFFVNIKDGISRFLTAFICSVLFFLTLSFEIIFSTNADEIIVPLCMTLGLVTVFSVFLKTAQEYISMKISSLIQYISCGVVAVAGFFLIKLNYESLYTIMAYTGIMIALVCFIFFVLMRGENRTLAFPKIVSSLIFTGAICSVLSSGLSTCIAAFQTLIFTWNDIFKLYLIVILFVSVVCYINIFLSFIPKKDVPVQQSKIFRSFVLFAGLPLYILLIAILLLYLAKIVITGHMPIGEINWFASFASLFFIFFLLSVMQYTEKIAKLFSKFGGYLLAPVLIMQAIAVFERINAYGLTTPRTISLVLIIISILFIAGSVIIPKHLNKISLISGILVLVVTVTPFNVIDMPVASQTNILKTVLTANDMIVDGKVVPKSDISTADAQKIVSAYEYLDNNLENIPDFIPHPEMSIEEIFGFTKNYAYGKEESDVIYCRFCTKDYADITGYNKVSREIDRSDSVTIDYKGQPYEIDLKQVANSLYAEYGAGNHDIELYKVDEKISLYFNRFSVSITDGEVTYCSFNGYAFLKD